jgi:hypothetical protein
VFTDEQHKYILPNFVVDRVVIILIIAFVAVTTILSDRSDSNSFAVLIIT